MSPDDETVFVYCPDELKDTPTFDGLLTEAGKPCWSCGKMAPPPYEPWHKDRRIWLVIAFAISMIILVYVLPLIL